MSRWLNGPISEGTQVVVIRSGEYENRVGVLEHDNPQWQTIGVSFGCVNVRLGRDEVRRVRFGEEMYVVPR